MSGAGGVTIFTSGHVLCEFTAIGKPEPQGSAKAMVPLHPKTKQPYRRAGGGIVVNVTTDNPALKAWRHVVAACASAAYDAAPVEGVGVEVEATFYLARPKTHYGTGRNATTLKPGAPARPIVRPDADKLLRGVLDALTGVVWKDDSQVTDAIPRKRFAELGESTGVVVRVALADLQSVADLSGALPLTLA